LGEQELSDGQGRLTLTLIPAQSGSWRRFVIPLIAALAVILIFILNHRRSPSTTSLQITANDHPLAPDFSLPDLSGKPLTLSSLRGKVVLLDFWATWCVPCRQEIPRFIELQNQYGDHGLQIIGVSMDDSPDPVRDFYQQLKMNYPVVMGDAKTGEQYGGVLGLPIAFIIGRDGKIYSKHIGATSAETFEEEIVKLLQPPA
jgi:thiol-disulfide isomerase/thioredoxin